MPPPFKPVSREQVFRRLFGRGAAATWNVADEGQPDDIRGFKTTTRRIKLFSDVPAAEQPWFGQAEHGETIEQKSNTPYKQSWKAQWMVYHKAGDIPGYEPTIWNNLILDALMLAMAPTTDDPGYLDRRNTLSGLVHHCFVSGEVFKDPGDIDNQALLIIPITILVP